jgi:hypothetical protein
MNDRQNAKLNMAQRVSDTLTAYADVYSDIVPVQKAVAQYQQIIADIRAVAIEQFAVKAPVLTQEKRMAEDKMIEVAVRVANTLYVVGFESGNKELTNLLGLSDSSFYRVEDNAKLTLAQRLYGLAQQHAAELAPYGYDGEKIAEIGAAIDGYKNLIAKPMNAIAERKQKTTNLKELFARLDSALYDKLDKLLVLFKSSNPDFYGEYRTARNFIDFSTRHKQAEQTEQPQ